MNRPEVRRDVFQPRDNQKKVLAYTRGRMGVAAVPGSGKTSTLSRLAADLVRGGGLEADQEVLIVTLVNAAVDHFAQQVGRFVREDGLLPGVGYRVRTLHGLANDIVRERPALVGLSEGFQIVDEREAGDILRDAVTAWTRSHPDAALAYLSADVEEGRAALVQRDQWPEQVSAIAGAFIKQAKDLQLLPEDVRRLLAQRRERVPLAEMALTIYIQYQRGLSYRGGVDFQDLIRLALRALQLDKDFLKRLKHRWPYILEDEAQDSSLLQEEILRTLSGSRGNWVRVGDPNQAIYETFTTAKPEYLRNFLAQRGVKSRELPDSGRSTASIIDLANALVRWSRDEHPVAAVRERVPLDEPFIQPTPPDDPQPNPPDRPDQVHLYPEQLQPNEEIELVTQSLKRWLADNPTRTVAVLVPRNQRGADVVRALKNADLDVVELLRSTSSTREAAGSLARVLGSLAHPYDPSRLAEAYRVWRRDDRDDADAAARVDRVARLLRGCRQVEDYLWPVLDNDWLDSAAVAELVTTDEAAGEQLLGFREVMRRWQQAVMLPVDQLLLTVAQDVFFTAVDLAIAHSLALHLRHIMDSSPHWRLPEFAEELVLVARNQRRVVTDLGDDGSVFDPDKHRGKVTVATMHRAKGLEWDRVYLLSVNNYDFPSAEPQDSFLEERWWVRDKLNLQAEALDQLASVVEDRPYEEGTASVAARIDYAAERLRLLYVGITRARQELVITWNSGRRGDSYPATPLVALQGYWERRRQSPPEPPKKKPARRKKREKKS